MYICNYCNSILKEHYEKCPNCGGTSFSTKSYLGEIIIKEPPKDGYHLNKQHFIKEKKNNNIFLFLGIGFILFGLISCLPFLIFSIFAYLAGVVVTSFVGFLLIIVSNPKRKRLKNQIKKLDKLSKKGILVKKLPYEIVNTGTMVFGKYYKCIRVDYKNSQGISIPLFSETKYDIENHDIESVDLLIDPDDYSNYFIDYEIY